MSVKFSDRIIAVADEETMPLQFAALFAKAGLQPPRKGQKLSIASVDAAIKELTIDDRMMIKSALNRAGLI